MDESKASTLNDDVTQQGTDPVHTAKEASKQKKQSMDDFPGDVSCAMLPLKSTTNETIPSSSQTPSTNTAETKQTSIPQKNFIIASLQKISENISTTDAKESILSVAKQFIVNGKFTCDSLSLTEQEKLVIEEDSKIHEEDSLRDEEPKAGHMLGEYPPPNYGKVPPASKDYFGYNREIGPRLKETFADKESSIELIEEEDEDESTSTTAPATTTSSSTAATSSPSQSITPQTFATKKDKIEDSKPCDKKESSEKKESKDKDDKKKQELKKDMEEKSKVVDEKEKGSKEGKKK